MKRFDCMKILASRLHDELVVLSLGGSVDEWYNAAPHMREASLFQQQLGCLTAEALGLAIGLPHRKVIALETDGGIIFNLGILATIGNEQPPNLFIIVWDNQCYLSIGGPPTHTAGRLDICAVARGAGVTHAQTAKSLDEFERGCDQALLANQVHLLVAKVEPETRPGLQRKSGGGVEDTLTFVRHIERTEGVVIIGSSEHN